MSVLNSKLMQNLSAISILYGLVKYDGCKKVFIKDKTLKSVENLNSSFFNRNILDRKPKSQDQMENNKLLIILSL